MIADGQRRDVGAGCVTNVPPYPSGVPAGTRTERTRVSTDESGPEIAARDSLRRRHPVESEARAHGVEDGAGKHQGAGRSWSVDEPGVETRVPQRRDGGVERLDLRTRGRALRLVRPRELREGAGDPRDFEARSTPMSSESCSGRTPRRPIPVSSLTWTGSGEESERAASAMAFACRTSKRGGVSLP